MMTPVVQKPMDKLETGTTFHDTKTKAGEKPERLGAARARSSVHLDVLVSKEGMGPEALPWGWTTEGEQRISAERSEQTQNSEVRWCQTKTHSEEMMTIPKWVCPLLRYRLNSFIL